MPAQFCTELINTELSQLSSDRSALAPLRGVPDHNHAGAETPGRTVKAEPWAIRTYADQLAAAGSAAQVARAYVNASGSFSFYEAGLIGVLSGKHARIMDGLSRMLQHLADLTDESDRALRQAADLYARTDQHSAARIDATYPAVPRGPLSRD